MLRKKICVGLVAGVLSLSLILGQGVVCAADINISSNIENGITRTLSAYRVTGNGVRLRAEPNTSSTILGLLYFPEIIQVERWSSDGAWVYARTESGVWGWVSTAYIEMAVY
ncbi:SH3 domain-containing protein [Ruminiclostridium cellulolyticum]|uniref:SH3 type 3 domain protein n=1 Tax=Ruminiclostridium cellulolyticum (strain ATCC 35319 / DSM 5812 / JCM 6584 / H10) TaxID=394503 RepID=B8I398_RUMCH|nr:SH3 domain-containing protein [Ruminiclostridium cellulolyticum]ACL76241.1 SH3 type 3 domain protein [Ruminiclostridium cellulolyticum H10]